MNSVISRMQCIIRSFLNNQQIWYLLYLLLDKKLFPSYYPSRLLPCQMLGRSFSCFLLPWFIAITLDICYQTFKVNIFTGAFKNLGNSSPRAFSSRSWTHIDISITWQESHGRELGNQIKFLKWKQSSAFFC